MTVIEIAFGALGKASNIFHRNKLESVKNVHFLLEKVILFCVIEPGEQFSLICTIRYKNKYFVSGEPGVQCGLRYIQYNTKTNILYQESQAYNVD